MPRSCSGCRAGSRPLRSSRRCSCRASSSPRPIPEEAAIEVAAFAFIGAFVSWLIDVQNREKTQHRGTIASLEWTQRELRSHIEAVENEERRLSTINAVLSVVAESLDLRQMLHHAMDKVEEIMRVEKWLLYLLDEDSDELTLEAYHGVSDEFTELAKRIPRRRRAERARRAVGRAAGDERPVDEPRALQRDRDAGERAGATDRPHQVEGKGARHPLRRDQRAPRVRAGGDRAGGRYWKRHRRRHRERAAI